MVLYKGKYSQLVKEYGEKNAKKIQKAIDLYNKASTTRQNKADVNKQINEAKINKHQNRADLAQSRIDKSSARKELAIYSKKNKYIDNEIKYTKQLYNHQIEIAKLNKNDEEVAKLKAERDKQILDYQVEKLQNYADENEAAYNLKTTQTSMTTDYKKKNALSKESVTALKSQYKYLINIAKKQGDTVEAKRLELELTQKIRETEKERINNIVTDYENRLTSNNRKMQIWENGVSLAEAKGMTISPKFYQSMADAAAKEVSIRSEARDKAYDEYQKIYDEHINDPAFFESQEFYDIVQSYNDAENALEQAEISYAQNMQKAIEANWEMTESAQQAIDRLNDEAETFKSIFEYKDMFDKNGVITEEGTAVFALDVYEIKNHTAKIKKYNDEIDNLNKLYKEGKISPERYTEQMQKLKDGVLDSTEAIYSMRDAMKSLIEEGLGAELDALNDMIDKVKQNLSDAKSLRDYQKNIDKLTKNINSLERQIAAKSGDTSEAGRASVQKLKVQLEEAKSDLEDTEYDKYIEDQERILDDLSDDFQDYMDEQMEQVDTLLEGIISAVESGKVDISSAIKQVGDKIGVDLSKVLSESLTKFAATGKGNAEEVYVGVLNELLHSADSIYQLLANKFVIDTNDTPGKVNTDFSGGKNEDTKMTEAREKSTAWLKSKGYSDNNINTMYRTLDNAQALFTGLQNAASDMSAEDIYNAYWKEIEKGHGIEGEVPILGYLETQPYLDEIVKKNAEKREQRKKDNFSYTNQIARLLSTKTKPYEHISSDVLSSISKYGSQKFMEKYNKGYFLSSNSTAKQVDDLVKKIVDEETGTPLYKTSSTSDILNALINLNKKYENVLSDAAKGKISARKINGVGGFSKGGIVDTSTLSKIAEKNGDDAWVTVKSGEGILSPLDTQNLMELTKMVREAKYNIPTDVLIASSSTNKPIPNQNISADSNMYGDMHLHFDGSDIRDINTFVDCYDNAVKHSKKMQKLNGAIVASYLSNDTNAFMRV